MEAITYSEEETAHIATGIAKTIKPGDILLLRGDLGAGKTVLARALIRILSHQPDLDVPSPTFTLLQTYDTEQGPLWHFDLYRLKDSQEIYELGWEEALGDGIVVVEWPERLGVLKPARYLDIAISAGENSPDQRKIEITEHDSG